MINKLKKLGTSILIIFSSYSIYLYVDKIDLFNVKKIEIKENRFVREHTIDTILEKYKNKNINKLDIKEIQENINMHPYIKANKVFKMLPDRIIVNIKEIVPIAILEKNQEIYGSYYQYFYCCFLLLYQL